MTHNHLTKALSLRGWSVQVGQYKHCNRQYPAGIDGKEWEFSIHCFISIKSGWLILVCFRRGTFIKIPKSTDFDEIEKLQFSFNNHTLKILSSMKWSRRWSRMRWSRVLMRGSNKQEIAILSTCYSNLKIKFSING